MPNTVKQVTTYKSGEYFGIRYHLNGKLPPAPVVKNKWELWQIIFGFAGFNSPTNNHGGYVTKEKALAAIRRYQSK